MGKVTPAFKDSQPFLSKIVVYFFVKTFWNDFLYLFALVTVQFFSKKERCNVIIVTQRFIT